jgi:hypothetical protein
MQLQQQMLLRVLQPKDSGMRKEAGVLVCRGTVRIFRHSVLQRPFVQLKRRMRTEMQ